MGKGTIISGGTGGQYQVSVQYNVQRVQAEKAANLEKIDNLNSQITAETDRQKLNALKLQKLALEKRNEALDAIPESETISAWCADLSEDLTGDVGLIEVPGESTAFNIQPGHEGNAAYNTARDGQLTPTLAMSPAAAFYNLAMLPGWQKWKPTFRYGTITAISGDTADVSLESATSTQQGLGVNQAASLSDVPVLYMNCHGAAFEVDDEVLVKFTGQDWSSPVVIGFKDNPKTCTPVCAYVLLKYEPYEEGTPYEFSYVVWDVINSVFADIVWSHNGTSYHFDSWPIYDSVIETWWDEQKSLYTGKTVDLGTDAWNFDLVLRQPPYWGSDPIIEVSIWQDRDSFAYIGDPLVTITEIPRVRDITEEFFPVSCDEYESCGGDDCVIVEYSNHSIDPKQVFHGLHFDGRVFGGRQISLEYDRVSMNWHSGFNTCHEILYECSYSSYNVYAFANTYGHAETPHLVAYFTRHTLNTYVRGGHECDDDPPLQEFLSRETMVEVHVSQLHDFNLSPKQELNIFPQDVPVNAPLTAIINQMMIENTGHFYIDAFSYMNDEPE